MATASEASADLVLRINKEVVIDAPAALVFDSILEETGPAFMNERGQSMNMRLEAWPGGRWFRDLGNNTGHLWGHVQVIKPPTLLEICGPMMMSYAVASHVQYRLTENGGKTTLTLTHTAVGLVDPKHREGMNMGWGEIVTRIKARATK